MPWDGADRRSQSRLTEPEWRKLRALETIAHNTGRIAEELHRLSAERDARDQAKIDAITEKLATSRKPLEDAAKDHPA